MLISSILTFRFPLLSTNTHLKLIFKAFFANQKKKKNPTVYHNVTQLHFDIQNEDNFFYI